MKTSKDKLEFTSSPKTDKKKRELRIWVFAGIAMFFLALHYLVELRFFDFISEHRLLLKKATLTFFFIFLALMAGKLIEKLIYQKTQSIGHSYNLVRVTQFLTILFVFVMLLSFLFQNWYTAVVSFGLLSLILGFALQAPISSFIAWVYIIFRTPYRVGDRIQINGFKGDVIDVDYLDTTLLEFSGEYLGNDRRSGRIVRFPNSIVLKSEIFNYSGPQSPFIWNETAIQIAYTSDLKFVEDCLFDSAKEDFRERHGQSYQNSFWDPAVYFRVSGYAWLEAVITYPVIPTETTAKRNRIIKRSLAKLNEQPDKVLFPEGASR
jgi:small-conductance mechanosensitive channel